MTAQFSDGFLYRAADYAVAGISEGELFDPSALDMQPVGTCSACWRGYVVTYALRENHLVVADLDVNLYEEIAEVQVRRAGPLINGVGPEERGPRSSLALFNNHYRGIDYHLEYSGGLLLADGFIEELYVHMGFHKPWKYERVVELIFENGILTAEFDRSAQMEEVRSLIARSASPDDGRRPTTEEIRRFVDQAFDRSYERDD